MNILEDDHSGLKDVQICKISYLQAENEWISQEHDYLHQLISKYKDLVRITSANDLSEVKLNPNKFSEIVEELNTSLKTRISFYEDQANISSTFSKIKSQQRIQVEEFLQMAYSFENKIKLLQTQIKNREAQLQKIEKNKQIIDGEVKPVDSTNKIVNKAMLSYDIHSKMLESIKQANISLKSRKKILQEILLKQNKSKLIPNHVNYQNPALHEGSTTLNNSQFFKSIDVKNILKNNTLKHSENNKICQQNQQTLLQKIIKISKKKKFQNEHLIQKIEQLKKNLQKKEAINKTLNNQIHNIQWQVLDSSQVLPHQLPNQSCSELSVMNRTFVDCKDFTLDISRFLKSNHIRKM